jgi:nucleotide-binding universal stress UspA family protein
MYTRILVALDHTSADDSLLPHVTELARLTRAELLLVHVADGWAAQWQEHLNLADSQEIREDRAYLETIATRLSNDGLMVRPLLTQGDPSREITKIARAQGCDLIAMTTHGHRFIADFWLGSTIDKVRHDTEIPLLLVRAAPAKMGEA